MSKTPLKKIPYSTEAVENLLAIEREHVSWFYPNQPIGYKGECRGCYWDNNVDSDYPYPCPTLTKARAGASAETLVAVALLLGVSNE